MKNMKIAIASVGHANIQDDVIDYVSQQIEADRCRIFDMDGYISGVATDVWDLKIKVEEKMKEFMEEQDALAEKGIDQCIFVKNLDTVYWPFFRYHGWLVFSIDTDNYAAEGDKILDRIRQAELDKEDEVNPYEYINESSEEIYPAQQEPEPKPEVIVAEPDSIFIITGEDVLTERLRFYIDIMVLGKSVTYDYVSLLLDLGMSICGERTGTIGIALAKKFGDTYLINLLLSRVPHGSFVFGVPRCSYIPSKYRIYPVCYITNLDVKASQLLTSCGIEHDPSIALF